MRVHTKLNPSPAHNHKHTRNMRKHMRMHTNARKHMRMHTHACARTHASTFRLIHMEARAGIQANNTCLKHTPHSPTLTHEMRKHAHMQTFLQAPTRVRHASTHSHAQAQSAQKHHVQTSKRTPMGFWHKRTHKYMHVASTARSPCRTRHTWPLLCSAHTH
jgi:hypothetical protein